MHFFDSYAILEIIFQNKSYEIFENDVIMTNALNLSEVYYSLLLKYDRRTADFWMKNLDLQFMGIVPDISIEASRFKFEHKNEKLSYADCIGYVTARKHSLKFVTGDTQFKNKPNVVFVK